MATMYRYGRGRRVFRRRAAAVVSSMLARKIRGFDARHVSPESSFLEGSKKLTAPRLGNNAGEPAPAALIEAAPRDTSRRDAL